MAKRMILLAALLLTVARAANAQDYFPGHTAPVFGSSVSVSSSTATHAVTDLLPAATFFRAAVYSGTNLGADLTGISNTDAVGFAIEAVNGNNGGTITVAPLEINMMVRNNAGVFRASTGPLMDWNNFNTRIFRASVAAEVPTFDFSLVASSIVKSNIFSVAAGTAALASIHFGTATSGFYQVAAGNVATTGGTFRFDKSTYNNGASAAANQNYYGLAKVNNWGADSGMEIRARATASSSNAALELNGWVKDAASPWAAVQIAGYYNSTADGIIFVNATAPVFTVCNNEGVSQCENGMWKQTGNGVVTHNVWDLPNGNGIQTTSQAGYQLANPFAATVGRPAQWSPGLDFVGSAWKSNATAAAQANTLRQELQAVTGAAATTFNFVWKGAAAGAGSFTDLLSLSSTGALNASASGGSIGLARAFVTNTAPTSPTACTSPTVTWSNGTAVFQIDVGTTCAGVSTLVVTLPTTTNAYMCDAINTTTSATAEVEMTASSTTSATFTNYTRTTGVALTWVDGADIRISCIGG